MTSISTTAAFGMMPLWVYLVGSLLTEDDLTIPYVNLVFTLAMLILPLTFGMAIRYRLPALSTNLSKIIAPLTIFTMIFMLTVS